MPMFDTLNVVPDELVGLASCRAAPPDDLGRGLVQPAHAEQVGVSHRRARAGRPAPTRPRRAGRARAFHTDPPSVEALRSGSSPERLDGGRMDEVGDRDRRASRDELGAQLAAGPVMSTATVTPNVGTLAPFSVSRRAMVLAHPAERLAALARVGGAVGRRQPTGGRGGPLRRSVPAALTSRSTMRPPGPVPVTPRGSMPSSAASRLARGLMARRARPGPVVSTAASERAPGAAPGAASAASSMGQRPGAPAPGAALRRASRSRPRWRRPVPSPPRRHRHGAARPHRRPRSPCSTCRSRSRRAGSPFDTESPSCLNHARTVHSSVICPGWGMRMATAIR